MKHKKFFLKWILCGTLFIGCGATKQESNHAEAIRAAKERMAMEVPPSIPPNQCRVSATVIAIDSAVRGDKGPCATAPCMATVRIDSVLGYGSAFPKPLAPGEKLVVKFAYTLQPTTKEFPEVKPALPGLSVGARFVALVGGEMGMGQTEPAYSIYTYERQ